MPISIKDLWFTYDNENWILKGIDMEIKEGDFVCVVGRTGCGKTTLIEHLNGILKPAKGEVRVDGEYINAKNIWKIRKKVGLVFQYPEHQLFEETVEKEVAFGPKQMGFDESQRAHLVKEALLAVGLPFRYYASRHPFTLSEGEKRRVAIADILAMHPRYLVLDEPTVGLDCAGRKMILDRIKQLNEKGMTVIMITHRMEEALHYAKVICLMDDGKILLKGNPEECFQAYPMLNETIKIFLPDTIKLIYSLEKRKCLLREPIRLDYEGIKEIIMEVLKGR